MKQNMACTGQSRSVRIDSVLVVICVSVKAGRECGETAEFRDNDPNEAIRGAREMGWMFRAGAARCLKCGNAGRSFGNGGDK